jgi:hypothetical protein
MLTAGLRSALHRRLRAPARGWETRSNLNFRTQAVFFGRHELQDSPLLLLPRNSEGTLGIKNASSAGRHAADPSAMAGKDDLWGE